MSEAAEESSDGVGLSDSDDNHSGDDHFSDIEEFFPAAVFKSLSTLMKRHFKSQKVRYDACIAKGMEMQPPDFIKKVLDARAKAAKTADKKRSRSVRELTVAASRQSKRLKVKATSVPPNGDEDLNDDITEEAEDPMFSTIKIYFTPTEWCKMSVIAKKHALNSKNAYDEAIEKGLTTHMPKFMSRKEAGSGQTVQSSKNRCFGLSSCSEASASTSTDSTSAACSTSSVSTSISKQKQTPLTQEDNSEMSFNDSMSGFDLDMVKEDEGTAELGVTYNDALKEEIMQIAKAAVTNLQPNILDKLADNLIEKGVESTNDLNLVEDSWLSNLNLKEVQIKKIINKFHSNNDAGKVPQASSKKNNNNNGNVTKPLMRPAEVDIQPTSSRPQLASQTLDTKVLNYTIQWGKMRDSLLEKLEKNERPSASDRENMVQIISKDLKTAYEEVKIQNPTLKQKTPGRTVYKAIVNAIFGQFEMSFQDSIKGKVIGDGKFSLSDQIETCVENLYRSKSSASTSAVPVKGNRTAACIVPNLYAPVLTRAEKAEAEQVRLELLAMYRSGGDKDWDQIKQKLVETCGAQRTMIVAKKRIVADIMDKWPFLFDFPGMVCHLDTITNSSLLVNFQTFIQEDMENLISYLTIMSPAKIQNMKTQRAMALLSGEHPRLLGTIIMLAAHFKEDVSVLLSSVEDTILPHEVLDEVNLPSTPCLVSSGSIPLEAKLFFLFMEGTCIGSFQNASEAIICLSASYFIFGVHYPYGASVTLTFIERAIAQLSDADGLVKASTSSGTASRGALSKVQALLKKVEEFAQELVD